MARRPRLTRAQERLLAYPPTLRTWRCRHRARKDGGELGPCGLHVRGGDDRCALGHRRPSRPDRVWPLYVVACERAGIEPDGVPYRGPLYERDRGFKKR